MTQLLQNAAYGTAMIVAVVVLRRVLKDRLVPEARLGLWAVCLFRLLTPVSPESMWSLWGLVRRMSPAETEARPVVAAPVPGPVLTPEAGAPMVHNPLPAAPAGTVPAPAAAPAAFPWETVLLAVWIGVGLALAARYALSWRRTRRAVRSAIPLDRDDPRYALLPRWARLREGVMDGAPLTFGAARPTVVLSPGLYGERLACVLAHEAVHAERRDNLWHYVMAVALVVHWWNPMVWLMGRLLRRDIELACDKAAVKKLGADRRADYARVLVSMAAQGTDPAFCQTFGRKAAEERILSIMKWKKTSVLGIVLSLALVAGVTVAFASAPKEPDGPEDAKPAASDAVETPNVEKTEGADGAPGGQTGFAVQMNGSVVIRVIVSLDVLKEDLDIRVDEGAMSRAERELIFSQAQSIAVDGVIDWTFTQDNGLRHEELPEESTDTTTVSANGYWDQDGKFVPVNISQIVSKFILPQALMGEDTGTVYDPDDFPAVEVKVNVEVDEQGNSIVRDENGDVVIVGIQTPPCGVDGCTVTERHKHEGNRIYIGSDLVCVRSDCQETGEHSHDGVIYKKKAVNPTPEEYAAMLKQWVAQGAMEQWLADQSLTAFERDYDRAQRGETDWFMYNSFNGSALGLDYYVTERFVEGYPVNSKGETYGPDIPELYGGFAPDLILAEGTKGETGYVRASDLDCNYPGGVNNPEEALAYMEWLKTQPATRYIPLYDSEGNVIGQFGISNSEAGKAAAEPASGAASCPVCTAEGCAIEGRHEHGGVTYCGGAAHQNRGESTCDGSCLYCAQDSVTGGHHEESHHGGHH